MEYFKLILRKIIFGGGVVFDLGKWIIIAVVILLVINTFWLAIFVVDGASMEPNLHDGELILWNKNSYSRALPARGDVIVMSYPGDPVRKKYVKRVIGLPGERVDLYKGHVYIDKKLLDESYISGDIESEPAGTWQMGQDQYFVLGDNRPVSSDSRYFGAVDSRFILGKSVAIIFPRISLISLD